MKVFVDLKIRARNAESLIGCLDGMQRFLSPGWVRDVSKDEEATRLGSGHVMRCYRFEGEGNTPPAALWLAIEEAEADVSNVVPLSVGSLSIDQYNDIVSRFAVMVRKAEQSHDDIEVTTSAPHQDLEDWLPRRAAQLFRQFAGHANPSTGTSHPRDLERWNAFLVDAHQESVEVDPARLASWLRENCGWSEDVAHGLVIEYERGRHLLATYDQTR